MDFRQFLTNIQDLLYRISNLELMPVLIIITAVLFILLHGQRQNKTLAQLSIFAGFIPVLIHELGHAVTATLTGGRVTNIYMSLTPRKQLKTGAQGQAMFTQHRWFGNVLIAFMGYAAVPIVLILGVILAMNGLSIIFIGLLFIGTLYYFWHTSQKWIPIAILLVIGYTGIDMSTTQVTMPVINIIYSVVLGLLAGEAVQSIITTARVNFSNNRKDWDGTALRGLTLVPASIWWLVWAILSGYALYLTFLLLF